MEFKSLLWLYKVQKHALISWIFSFTSFFRQFAGTNNLKGLSD
jgi:hypothetical protein